MAPTNPQLLIIEAFPYLTINLDNIKLLADEKLLNTNGFHRIFECPNAIGFSDPLNDALNEQFPEYEWFITNGYKQRWICAEHRPEPVHTEDKPKEIPKPPLNDDTKRQIETIYELLSSYYSKPGITEVWSGAELLEIAINENDAEKIKQLLRLAQYELSSAIGTEKVTYIMKGVYSGE